MRHFVSLLMVLAMVVALAAPALAGASTETVTPIAAAAAVEALGQEVADTLTADVFVEADPEVYAETVNEMFKGEETITVNGAEYKADDMVLTGKATGNEVALAEIKEGELVKVAFSCAGISEPGANLTQEQFLEQYDVIVMVNGGPTPIQDVEGASIEVINGVVVATLPFGSNFAVFAK